MADVKVALSSDCPERGSDLEIIIDELPGLDDAEGLRLDFQYVDEFEEAWAASVGTSARGTHTAAATLDTTGLPSGAVYRLVRVQLHDNGGNAIREWTAPQLSDVRFHVREAGEPMHSQAELVQWEEVLREAQERRLNRPLGNPDDSDVEQFNATAVVERLLMTTRIRLHDVEIIPVRGGNTAGEEAAIVNQILEELGSGVRIDGRWWGDINANSRPLTVLRFRRVFASDFHSAAELVLRRRTEVLNLLALSRFAPARPLALIVESVPAATSRVYAEVRPYTGNLVGGFTSGESQRTLLGWDEATGSDPFLVLSLSLLRDPLNDDGVDSAFFRYWSLLEVIASNRVARGSSVTLLSGRPWTHPDGRPRTTDDAAPRVYELAKHHLLSRQVDERSWAAPAADLQDAVTAWYARRNATAHYGAFRHADPVQQAQSWYQHALKTQADEAGWLAGLRDAARDVVAWELSAAAGFS